MVVPSLYFFGKMNEYILKYVLGLGSIFLLINITSCTSSQQIQQTDTGKDSTYVFDEVPESDIITFDTPETKDSDVLYVIQIGAFTTKEKADEFANQSKAIIGKNVKVSFSQRVNLYVVHIDPPYKSKAEAESVRNSLWQLNGFQDAWIVTINNRK